MDQISAIYSFLIELLQKAGREDNIDEGRRQLLTNKQMFNKSRGLMQVFAQKIGSILADRSHPTRQYRWIYQHGWVDVCEVDVEG